MTRLKGIRFPSYDNPPQSKKPPVSDPQVPGRSLTQGKQWIGHSGKQSRIRYMKQMCRTILKSKDPVYIETLNRIKSLIAEDNPEPEFTMLKFISKCKEISDSTEVSWVETVNYMINKLLVEQQTITKDVEEIKP